MATVTTELEPLVERSSSTFLYVFVICLLVFQAGYAYAYGHVAALRAGLIQQLAIRLGSWTLPVVVYLVWSRQNVFDYLKLQRKALRGIAWGLVIGAVLAALNLAATYLQKGHVQINVHIGRDLWWKAVILVGFSEEVVFRGFLLAEFAKRTRFWIANLAQAGLFLAIHCPGWALGGQFVFPGIMRLAGFIFVIAVVLGVVWKKSGSSWGCILIHSINNFCSLAMK